MGQSLSVVIPAYNEEKNLDKAFDNVQLALDGIIDDYEIIVINDGSMDATAAVAYERMKKDARIKCFSNEQNRGYGYSYWRGVMQAGKAHVGVFPADNDMTWETFRDLVKHIGEADILTAYMSNPQDRYWPRRLLSRIFVILMNTAFGMRLKYFNGPLIGRRDLLQALTIRSSGLTILAECKVRLIKQGCSYLEVPFSHLPRHSGRSTALRLKSIKAVIVAVICLYRDLYWHGQRQSA